MSIEYPKRKEGESDADYAARFPLSPLGQMYMDMDESRMDKLIETFDKHIAKQEATDETNRPRTEDAPAPTITRLLLEPHPRRVA